MTQCIAYLKNFVSLSEDKNSTHTVVMTKNSTKKRKEMFNQLVKINLLFLIILLLNGISNSHQQKTATPSEEALQAFANHPIASKMFKKNF